MKKIISLSFFIVLWAYQSSAYIPTDTLNAHNMFVIGDSLSNIGDFSSSNDHYEIAVKDFRDLSYNLRALAAELKIADNHWRSGQYADSRALNLKIEKEAQQILVGGEAILADVYHMKGIIDCIQGDYKSALYSSFRSIEINKVLHGIESQWVASTLNNISVIYWYKGYLDSTQYYLEKVLRIQRKLYDENNIVLSPTYNNLGNTYLSQGFNHKAIEYINRAVELTKLEFSEEDYSLSSKYLSIGVAYLNIGMYDKAMRYYKLSLKLAQKKLGPNHTSIAKALTNLGNAHVMQANYLKGEKYLKLALEMNKQIFGDQGYDVVESYYNIGSLYAEKASYDHALYWYQKALGSIKGESNLGIGIIQDWAMIYERQNKFDSAIIQLEKSITWNTYDSASAEQYLNYNFEYYLNRLELLESISAIAECYHKQFLMNPTQRMNKLTHAYELFNICDVLTNEIQIRYLSAQERIEFSKKSYEVYIGALENSIALYEETKNESFVEKAFYFSEKSRSMSLLMASLEHSSLSFTNIPDSLRAQENNLKIDLHKLEEKLIGERLKGTDGDSSKINDLSLKHFNSKRDYESLIQTFASHYPKYHQLKYRVEKTTLQTIQEELISENQVILEYVNTDSTLYIFAISSIEFHIEQVKKDSLFLKTMDSFLAEIRDPRIYEQAEESFISYVKSSYDLYKYLLAPVANFIDQKELIIVPDNQLALLPFEALIISDETRGSYDFAKLDYMIKFHDISYANSVKHLFQESKRSQNFENIIKRNRLLAFAPSFEDLALDTQSEEVLRYNLVPLEGTADEVEKISQYFDTEIFSGHNATENYFKEKAVDFAVIHIASHAMINEKDPIQNKIAFAKNDKDSLNDGFLHVFELYNTKLHANMVVLSACNTGNGKATKGEGVFSLAKGFLYAGCKSVVMSLWLINDWSANGIMIDFYKYLSEGSNKSSALRHAKIDYLTQNSGFEAHPYYWAPFVISGDTSPITYNRNNIFIRILLVVTTLIFGYFLVKFFFNTFR